MLQQSQPVVAVVERPLSRREEMALKAMSLAEVRMYPIYWKKITVVMGLQEIVSVVPGIQQSNDTLRNPLDL